MKMLSVLLPFVLTFTSLTGWKLLTTKAGQRCTASFYSFCSLFVLTVITVYTHIILAESSEGEWPPLSTERLADHGRDKNKEQTPSIDCRGDGKRRRPVVKQLTVYVWTQLPRWPPERRKGSQTPPSES